jgi:hypothetical protein
MRLLLQIGALAAALAAAPATGAAFCGFYVSGADAELFNNATQVVLMRQGTRTVLSMQNNYQGPPQDFAMVVPVPVVLQEENVKTLPREIFRKVDQLSAPRLVEYWEQDPCMTRREGQFAMRSPGAAMAAPSAKSEAARDLGVTVEAQFKVGEYDIVILSAKDSTGLDTWLRQEKYKIPDGAEPYLAPYVKGGSKFFVAKVDASKVKFEGGQAMLSPLRFHYDAEEFSLPIRLGMMNSSGTQDLIVNILAPGQRYEVANYRNVTIPTNLDVVPGARERFGEFYAALFDRTLEKNPGAVVTEYSWDAASCDPCPTPPLDHGELLTLGADILDARATTKPAPRPSKGSKSPPKDAVDELLAVPSVTPRRPPPRPMPMRSFVITRLHARYSKDGVSEDLVFKTAPAIAGGRESRGPDGRLEERSVESPINNFQARYAIRHEWTGPIECANPVRGVWGGPPRGELAVSPRAATDLAFVARGGTQLAAMVRQDVPEIGLTARPGPTKTAAPSPEAGAAAIDPAVPTYQPKKRKQGCAVLAGTGGPSGPSTATIAMVLGLALLLRRRRTGGTR